jgi:hypothetical protein
MQTIGGRKRESEKESKKVDRDRSHKKTRPDYNETISGKPGTADSGLEVEIPTAKKHRQRGRYAISQELEGCSMMDD